VQVFSLKSMMSGLNNQRMGLVGLIAYAARQRAKAVLPSEVVDFSPGKDRKPSDYGRLNFQDVFDQDILLNSAASDFITTDEPTDVLGLDKCFAEGAAILTEARTQDTPVHKLARQTLLALEPSADLRQQANEIANWLPNGTSALQLRIEHDWQEYLIRKFGSTEVENGKEFLSVSAAKIAKKIALSDERPDTIWGCCDEGDLTVSLDDIRGDFDQYGLKILFKTDLPEALKYPEKRLRRAFLEFAVCRNLSGYIGLSRSSFSQVLWLDNIWRERESHHFVYNTPAAAITKR